MSGPAKHLVHQGGLRARLVRSLAPERPAAEHDARRLQAQEGAQGPRLVAEGPPLDPADAARLDEDLERYKL